ncbi:hypothetical protein ACQKP0_11780 [Heyndrickxia sp. NPDC080065]|uniref:hypothetical protein n=1 Tax=Heyndrickxia sp. NPDC080065 TaxID=3390568 RepID=UPI003D036CF9
MSNKISIDIYQILKMSGLKLEETINQSIQSKLNNEAIVKQFGTHSRVAAAVIKKLQNTVETVSIPLNFPTKNDVANATKINIQTEEKVDQIDEKVDELLIALKELKQLASKGGNQNG